MSQRFLSTILGLLLTVTLGLGQASSTHAACFDTIGTFDRGEIFSADVDSGLAYLGSGTMFMVLDLSTPSVPAVLGELKLDFIPRGIEVVGDFAYMIGPEIHVVDISDPTAPALINTVNFNGTTRTLASFPGFLLVTDFDSLKVYDLSTPEAPALVDSLFVNSPASGHIEIVGNLAFFPTNEALYLVDFTTPDDLSILSNVDVPSARGVRVTGSHAVVVGNFNQGVVVLDVSDPANPTPVGSLFLQNLYVEDVQLFGDFAIAGTVIGQLLTLDISDPTAPVFRRITSGRGTTDKMFSDGTTLYVNQREGGLRVVDASDPLDLQEISTFATPAAIGRAQRQGDHLFLAAGEGGVRVLDISAPSQPTEVATYQTGGEAYDLRLVGNTAFVADGTGGFLSLDITDPLNIQELDRRTDHDMSKSLDLSGDLAYVADEFFGLRLVDVSSPAALVEVGQLEIGNRAGQLVYDDALVYLADGHDGLRIFDVSDPMLPQQVGQRDTPGLSDRLSKGDGFVFINNRWSGESRVIDVSDPNQPDLTTIEDCLARAILLDGELGYISCGFELRLVRISPSGSVSTLATRDLNRAFTSITKDGDRLYLGHEETGLEIVDLNGCDGLLADGFESGDLSAWSASVP